MHDTSEQHGWHIGIGSHNNVQQEWGLSLYLSSHLFNELLHVEDTTKTVILGYDSSGLLDRLFFSVSLVTPILCVVSFFFRLRRNLAHCITRDNV